jgi:hypothetical protein
MVHPHNPRGTKGNDNNKSEKKRGMPDTDRLAVHRTKIKVFGCIAESAASHRTVGREETMGWQYSPALTSAL